MTRALAAACLLLAGALPAAAQEARITVGEDRLLSTGITRRPVVESRLAVHPSNPAHLLATAMIAALELPDEGLDARSLCGTWLSTDGGATWRRHEHPVPGCADPWVAITPRGTALFVALGNDGTPVFRSADGGATWDAAPVPLGDGHDHPTLVVDTTGGTFGGAVYLASGRGGRNPEHQFRWTVYVAHSGDDGRSFPHITQVIPSNLSYEAHLPAVLSDGTLFVPFSDHHTMDGRRIAIGARRSWVLRSGDGGGTFTAPLFITDQCDGRGGWPSLVAAPEDVLLFTCIAPEFGGVLVFRSTDRGESWSEGVRADAGGPRAVTRIPTIAVAPSGVIAVSWYDRREDPARACQHVRFGVSTDGGASFHPDIRVSTPKDHRHLRCCDVTTPCVIYESRAPRGGLAG